MSKNDSKQFIIISCQINLEICSRFNSSGPGQYDKSQINSKLRMLVASRLLITSASVIYLLQAASSIPPSLLLLFLLVFQDSISYKYSTTRYNLLPLNVTRRRLRTQLVSTPALDVVAMMSKPHECHILGGSHKLRPQCSETGESENVKYLFVGFLIEAGSVTLIGLELCGCRKGEMAVKSARSHTHTRCSADNRQSNIIGSHVHLLQQVHLCF